MLLLISIVKRVSRRIISLESGVGSRLRYCLLIGQVGRRPSFCCIEVINRHSHTCLPTNKVLWLSLINHQFYVYTSYYINGMHNCDIGNLKSELLSYIRWQMPAADWTTLGFLCGTYFIALLARVVVVQATYEKYCIIGLTPTSFLQLQNINWPYAMETDVFGNFKSD